MSIINQTLRELDARKATAGGVPPPSAVGARQRDWRPAIAWIVLALGVALVVWLKLTASPHEATPPLRLSEARPAAVKSAPRAVIPPVPTPVPEPAKPSRADVSPRAESVAAAVADPNAQRSAKAPETPADAAPRAPASAASPGSASEALIRKDFSPPDADAQAEAHYRRAAAFAQSGRESEARALLHEAVRIAPRHVAARHLLATLLHEAGQNDAAEAVLAAGLRASPEHAWFALSLAAMQAERGDVAAAVATLRDGIERRTVDAEYRATLAALLLRLDRHADASRQYEQALGMAPGHGRWWMGLGLALEGEGKAAAARAAYSRALVAGDLPEKLVDFVQSKLETR